MPYIPARVLRGLEAHLKNLKNLHLLDLLDDPEWQSIDLVDEEGAKHYIVIGKLGDLDILAGLNGKGAHYLLKDPSGTRIDTIIPAEHLEGGILKSPFRYLHSTSKSEKRRVGHLIKYYFMRSDRFEGSFPGDLREYNKRFHGMLLEIKAKKMEDITNQLPIPGLTYNRPVSELEGEEPSTHNQLEDDKSFTHNELEAEETSAHNQFEDEDSESQNHEQGPTSKSHTESTASYDPAENDNSEFSIVYLQLRNRGFLPLWEQLSDRNDVVFEHCDGLPDGAHPMTLLVGEHKLTQRPIWAYLHKSRSVYDVAFLLDNDDSSEANEIGIKEVCKENLESPFDLTFENLSKVKKTEQLHLKTIIKWYFVAAGALTEGLLHESPRDFPQRLMNTLEYIDKIRALKWNEQQASLAEELSELDADEETPQLDADDNEIPESPLPNTATPSDTPSTIDELVVSKSVQQVTPESLPEEAEVSSETLMEMLQEDSRLQKGLGDLDTKIAGLKRKREEIETEIENVMEERRAMESARKKAREAFRKESTHFR
ncbi:hypothetical protein K491DRAFT_687805 [Lophiostoma macrostomum CBS 122681]|uniref:Uncharacterized protein n=1 Tax=Lophiostoma macrostomum CBS 122681 TaxID=1314788 RepID=A0A6A6TP78_9PLEO|nr:hypothetical protein K491DRAFT_687805 [Lophiostoma macrostomum CBS 122681]